MKNIRTLLSLFATAAVLTQTTAKADTAFNIANTYGFGAAVTYDDNSSGNFPVITSILSAPSGSVYNPGATLDGYTYRNWSYLAQDTTGSLDIFYSSSAAGPLANYPVPTVGDTILVQGVWSPFSGIAEVANGTAQAINVFGPGSTGNAPYTPSPILTTIPTINVGTNSHGVSASGLSGALLQLNNVTISGAGANWAVHANVTGTITDESNNSMTMFLWASSYSTCGAIAQNGDPVPTGLVDMVGFISDFYNTSTLTTTPEFVPISITVVPEPAAVGLCGLASVLAWVGYRRCRKA